VDKSTETQAKDCSCTCSCSWCNMFLLTMLFQKIRQFWGMSNIISILAAIVVYMLNTFILKQHTSGIVLSFCRCYLNDLICPFFILAYARGVLAWAGIKTESFWQILLIGTIFGLFFELIGPIINSRSVSDPFDFLCYCLGTILYFFAIKLYDTKKKPMD